MKLPASLLATVALAAGCEQAVDFERRSAPPVHETTTTKAPIETVRVIEDRPYAQPPGAAPIVKPQPAPAPLVIKPRPKPVSKPKPKVAAHVCGPCGMG